MDESAVAVPRGDHERSAPADLGDDVGTTGIVTQERQREVVFCKDVDWAEDVEKSGIVGMNESRKCMAACDEGCSSMPHILDVQAIMSVECPLFRCILKERVIHLGIP